MPPSRPIPTCGRKVHVRELSAGRQVGDVLPADVVRISRPQQDGVENPDILDLVVFGEESAAAVNRKGVPFDDGTITSGHVWSWPPMPAPAEPAPSKSSAKSKPKAEEPPAKDAAKTDAPPPVEAPPEAPAETTPPEAPPAEPSKS